MKTPFRLICATLLAVACAGCNYDDDNDDDHKVPDGKGSIIVDNNTADDIAVYIDGTRLDNVDDYSDKAYDLDPGVHRVVIDDRDGDRSYRDDVDVLEGRRTVLDVSAPTFDSNYDVVVFFD